MVDRVGPLRNGARSYPGSLLDRLVDHEPELAEEQIRSAREDLIFLRDGIRRDLEMILNRRAPLSTAPPSMSDLQDSLVCLGVSDLFSAALLTEMDRKIFALALEDRIARFEPRLKNVTVKILPSQDPSHRSLRLRITAEFTLHPGLPALIFDSQLDPTTHRFKVEEAGRV